MNYPVAEIDVDLWNYYPNTYIFRYVDFQVKTVYKTPYTYNIFVHRVDCNMGWDDTLQLLIYNNKTKESNVVDVPPATTSNIQIIEMTTESEITPKEEKEDVTALVSASASPPPRVLNLPTVPPEIRISKEKFNSIFKDAGLRALPSSLFAVGLSGGLFYIYNSNYAHYENIKEPIYHIIRVALKYEYDKFYFVVSSTDGYMESTYISHTRTKFKEITEDVLYVGGGEGSNGDNGYLYIPTTDDEIPVFHNRVTILAQSIHVSLPFAAEIVDRHYFYHNLYHSFRSFHQGIPFLEKQKKLVFCGQARDTAFNFDTRRGYIHIPPRQYFKEFVAPVHRDFVVCPSGWMERTDMALNYRYILNIDGRASCYDATAWLLNSGSVIFKQRSVWRQWFYDGFIAGTHYVELKEGFEDLREKWEWCESHPDECEEMIRRCKLLFQETYCYSNVVSYTRRLIEDVLL